jgi:hypothetical protein
MFKTRAENDRPHVIRAVEPQHRAGLDRAHAVQLVRTFEPGLAILAHIAGADVHAEAVVILIKGPAQTLLSVEKDTVRADDFSTQQRRHDAFIAAAITRRTGRAGTQAVMPVFGMHGMGGQEQTE